MEDGGRNKWIKRGGMRRGRKVVEGGKSQKREGYILSVACKSNCSQDQPHYYPCQCTVTYTCTYMYMYMYILRMLEHLWFTVAEVIHNYSQHLRLISPPFIHHALRYNHSRACLTFNVMYYACTHTDMRAYIHMHTHTHTQTHDYIMQVQEPISAAKCAKEHPNTENRDVLYKNFDLSVIDHIGKLEEPHYSSSCTYVQLLQQLLCSLVPRPSHVPT